MILGVGLLVMLACLALQAAALVLAVKWLAQPRTHGLFRGRGEGAFSQLAILMVLLMLGNVVQISIWALLYRLLGAVDDMEAALYFSGVTFTTLGYGDVVLRGRVRLLAPLQAANGVMMFGITTAAFTSVIQRVLTRWIAERAVDLEQPK